MTNCQKILVCGDVQGKLDIVYTRVEKLLKKGSKFDMLLCVGDFFTDGQDTSSLALYQKGIKKVPILTYILGPNNQKQVNLFIGDKSDGFEFCDNIIYLGKKGVFVGASGLRIAYLSGCESPAGSGPCPKHCFSQEDVTSLISSVNATTEHFKSVDILLTSAWPKGVTAHGNAPSIERCKNCGSELISALAKSIKPRYHFSGLEGISYERLPYRNHKVLAETSCNVTRFISLAPVGNNKKQKYLYAFSITPLVHMAAQDVIQQPPETTECPYSEKVFELLSNDIVDQYRWKMNHKSSSEKKRKSDGNYNQPEKKMSRPQDWSCWFCLGGEKVEKHLVASVGNLCYVALAKGGLTPDHVLILPIAHHQSSLVLPEDTRKEADMFKQTLMDAFQSEGRPCVVFERNYRTDHMQIQVVPLPPGITSDDIKQAFYNLAVNITDRQGRPFPLELTELPKQTDLKQIFSPGTPFFHAELHDGTRLLHRIQKFFPLQFGREALCSSLVLDEPERADWRACILSRDEEAKATSRFREFFKPHDFTLTEDEDSS